MSKPDGRQAHDTVDVMRNREATVTSMKLGETVTGTETPMGIRTPGQSIESAREQGWPVRRNHVEQRCARVHSSCPDSETDNAAQAEFRDHRRAEDSVEFNKPWQTSSGAANEPHVVNSAETTFRRTEAVWKKCSRPCNYEENRRHCDRPSGDAAQLTNPTAD